MITSMRMAPSFWIVPQLRSPRLVLFAMLAVLLAAAPALAANVSPDAEQEILRLLNRERQARHLPALVDNEALRQAARHHSERMATAGRIGHQLAGEAELSLRLGRKSQPFDANGENVALAADAAAAHSALMHSPGHRANILDPQYNSVGIGVVRRGGEIFVTQDFAHLLASSTVEAVEEKVATTLTHTHSSLKRIPAPELRQRACEMAEHDQLNPRAGMPAGATGSAVFTALDVDQIPRSLRSLKSRPASAFSVGACYQSSASYGNPVYWIIVVTYPPERASKVATSGYLNAE
jgi:uncharacterized protein YkwD